jgi:hypothetical protein
MTQEHSPAPPTATANSERNRWFDDWRCAHVSADSRDGDALRQIIAEVGATVAASETRQRRRREVDQRRHETAIEVVVANLAHAVLLPAENGTAPTSGSRLAILTGNGTAGMTRYDNPALGKPLRTLLHQLDEHGVLHWQSSTRRGEASSITPTDAFSRSVRAAAVSLRDFGRLRGEETIILARKRKLQVEGGAAFSTREAVDYHETAETAAMRKEVETLNTFMDAANVTFHDDGHGPVDPFDRAQRRYFTTTEDVATPSFDRAGRLFGGFWQNLKSNRRGAIRIDGEPVANLDFSSLYPRLALAAVGADQPTGDIYAIPGLEGHRAAVKKAMNCLLMDDFTRRSWPDELVQGDEVNPSPALIPPGWTVKRMRTAILERHPAMASCLGTGMGLKLMNTESRILLAVLGEMRSRGIVGLGLHDGLMVPRSRAEEVKLIMEMMGMEVSSVRLPITIKNPEANHLTPTSLPL